MKTVVVVPTIRGEQVNRFLSAWKTAMTGSTIIVVEDQPEKTFEINQANVFHYSWKDIDYELQDKSWIIPRRTDCIRSYGFLKAGDMGADVIITMDDDCFPVDGLMNMIVDDHEEQIGVYRKPICWRRTFLHESLAPRGLPYDGARNVVNVVNVGLWKGIPDAGSVEVLSTFRNKMNLGYDEVSLTSGTLQYGMYIPMCGMNLAFRSDMLPIMYFPIMGSLYYSTLNSGLELRKQPFDRYGDMWAGVLVKRALDHLRLGMSFGDPLVYHTKLSDPYQNLAREAAGVAAHEKFWRWIDTSVIQGSTPAEVYLSLADVVEKFPHDESDGLYWERLAEAMRIWVELVECFS